MAQKTISRPIAWIMWLLISLFYAYQYILRILPTSLMPELMDRFHLDVATFGQFSGLYYLGYASAHIPLGLLLDRKGLKFIIPACIVLTIVGLVPLILANHLIYLSIGILLIGMGSSAAALGAFKIIRLVFPEKLFSRMLGLFISIGLIGAIYGSKPVNYFLHTLGTKPVLMGLALVGLGLALCILLMIPTHTASNNKSTSILDDLKTVFGNSTVLSIAFFAGLMVGPLEGFANGWGAEFLRSTYHFDKTIATTLPSYIYLGMCFGTPLFTYFADKTEAYFKTIIVAAFVMCIAFVYVLTGMGTILTLYVAFSLIGVMCAYQVIALYKASTFVPLHLIGLTTACVNMIIMAFGYLFHSSIGFLIQSQWDGTTDASGPIYSFDSFISSLSVIPEALLIAGYGFILVSRRDVKIPIEK